MKNILFIAPPAGGKGTLSDELVEKCGYIHLSTGDMLRSVDKTSELRIKVNDLISKGELVPDEIVFELLKESLNDIQNRPFILDGIPRNISQAKGIDVMLDGLGLKLDIAVLLEVPYDLLLKRVSGRLNCPKCKSSYNIYTKPPHTSGICDKCGMNLFKRDDDNIESFNKRYNTFLDTTMKLKDYYDSQGKLMVIDGVNNTFEELLSVIK